MNPHPQALSAIVSALHLLALAIGFSAIHQRARALRMPLDDAGVRRVLAADDAWAVAALLWLGTGLWRAFGGLEKGAEFYMATVLFHAKMGLFVLVFLLELRPMITFIGWRRARARGAMPDTSRAHTLATLSRIEMAVVVVMVFVAAFMARGFGLRPS
jgi:putative membrane protein